MGDSHLAKEEKQVCGLRHLFQWYYYLPHPYLFDGTVHYTHGNLTNPFTYSYHEYGENISKEMWGVTNLFLVCFKFTDIFVKILLQLFFF